MSFLNPVNEPVLRFSSTDAGAPQISYNSRSAGDVKAVIKACLVTGYGAKAGAGWSIVNEVSHVAEFISPSVAMSDYRLKIDDTSTTNTNWKYIYQNTLKSFQGGVLSKNNPIIFKTSAQNRWDLIVTPRGFFFVETVNNQYTLTPSSSVLYFGAVKSLTDAGGENIAFWCVGFNSDSESNGSPSGFFAQAITLPSKHVVVTNNFVNYDEHVQIKLLTNDTKTDAYGAMEIWDRWFYRDVKGEILLQQPGVLLHARPNTNSAPAYYPTELNGRPVVTFMPIRGVIAKDAALSSARALIAVYLDYWEY